MYNQKNQYIFITGISAFTLLGIFLGCILGPSTISLNELFYALIGSGENNHALIIYEVRLPRILCAYVVGFALGISGAALQGLLRNPLAEPGVLGVSSSATLTATFVLYYGISANNAFILPVASISGAMIATAIIIFAALRVRSTVTLILIGVGISSLSGAIMSVLLNFAPNPFFFFDLTNWMLGSVANRSINDLFLSFPFILAGILILNSIKQQYSLLNLGEETAISMGLNINKLRILTVIACGIATGGAVSIAGIIGFVGLITPHIVRPFVNYDASRSIILSGAVAGTFLIYADVLAKNIPSEIELKLGVITAIIGAPVFIWISLRRHKIYD